MAVKKSFQVLSDLLVFNSIEPTIMDTMVHIVTV